MFEEFDELHAKTSFLMNKYRFICEDNVKNKSLLDKKKEELDMMKKSSIVVNKAAEDTLKSLESNIGSIVNKALSCVFQGDSYEMHFLIGTRGQKTKQTTMKVELRKNGVCFSKNLTETVEGGVLAVISIILRASFVLLREDNRRILLLDECFSPIARIEESDGDSNLKRAFKMIEQLAEAFNIQIITVTHCYEK